jgi:hypothetical protein
MIDILSIDPSGNFEEGKGKTGYCCFNGATKAIVCGTIAAKDYDTRVDYWHEVAKLIVKQPVDVIIVEDYRLYNTAKTGASVQSFSQLETPRLLGILETTAYNNGKKVVWQMANVTTPYSDDKLEKLGVIKKVKNRWYFKENALNDHERSALRHLLRYTDKEGIKI